MLIVLTSSSVEGYSSITDHKGTSNTAAGEVYRESTGRVAEHDTLSMRALSLLQALSVMSLCHHHAIVLCCCIMFSSPAVTMRIAEGREEQPHWVVKREEVELTEEVVPEEAGER